MLENRSRSQRLGSLMLHCYVSTKWQIQRRHKSLNLAFGRICLWNLEQQCWKQLDSPHTSWGDCCLQRKLLQNFLGWPRCCISMSSSCAFWPCWTHAREHLSSWSREFLQASWASRAGSPPCTVVGKSLWGGFHAKRNRDAAFFKTWPSISGALLNWTSSNHPPHRICSPCSLPGVYTRWMNCLWDRCLTQLDQN